jgi:GTPase SAR1 family protein
MVGLDAAGKTTILYKLKLGEIVTTIPTIGQWSHAARASSHQPPSFQASMWKQWNIRISLSPVSYIFS